jgi:ATP-dependent helicase/DNAse subunit B
MAITIEEHTLPEHASYSSISTYLACGWQYYLGRVLKLQEAESVWSVGGSAFHLAAEMYDLQEENNE